MGEEAICTGGRIWDLHIHSNQCTSADDSIKDLSANEYVDKLFDLFDDYELLDMISFTDHNRINLEVYQAFLNSDKNNGSVVLLPGCEIDVKLDEEGTSKHLVVYFDAINDLKELERISEELNGFIEKEEASSENPILIDKLLKQLTDLKIAFVLSPHAFKQNKRGIDYDWTSPELADKGTSKFIDQFFCFWEAGGPTNIARAQDFLNQMACGDKQCVVAFSDSRNLVDLDKYLNKPCQYFHALPSFTGLQMAGSDINRLSETAEEIKPEDRGGYIGYIEFDDNQIQCSPRMNAIIGGRGSGKSILLDALAHELACSSEGVPQTRLDFIENHSVTVSSVWEQRIAADTFRCDYFNQSYISQLFEKTGEEFNRRLEGYFQDAFGQITAPQPELIITPIQESFFTLLGEYHTEDVENITGFIQKLQRLQADQLNIKVYKNQEIKTAKELVEYRYQDSLSNIDNALQGAIPTFLHGSEKIDNAVQALKKAVCEEAQTKRAAYLTGPYLYNALIENLFSKKNEISAAHKTHSAMLTQLEKSLLQRQLAFCKRVAVINAYLEKAVDFETHCEEVFYASGENPESFCFKKTLDIEHPLKHMLELFEKYMKQPQNAEKTDAGLLWAYINLFCFKEDCYKSNKNWESLYEELKKFDLECTPGSSIWYKEPTQDYENIANLSPGTQTNILLEYIVHKDTKNPLLIDQPEDNVDNRTIYEKIKNWFLKLKSKRQVFVVTHDANIVINADAENIIIAEQEEPEVFSYTFGALEYEDNIDKAATILDGGKEAVQRRLLKYGES